MEAVTRSTDSDLGATVASAVAGDEYAFARLVAAYHEDMRRVCALITRDDGLAEDAVQSAWAIVWRKMASIRQPERIRPWLVSIAVNQAKDQLRKRKRRSEVEMLANAQAVGGGIDPSTGVDSLDLLRAMDQLDPDDRALIAMRYVVGFDASEIASAIGLSPSGTRARLSRILGKLRQELEHD
jgi:RNA polymerase sigma factor (sigma-70 family)